MLSWESLGERFVDNKEIKWLIEVFIPCRIKDDSKNSALQVTTFHVCVREKTGIQFISCCILLFAYIITYLV